MGICVYIYTESSSSSSGQKKEKRERKRRRVGRSIERSASAVAQTLRTCEEQREIRHQQLMELKKRRLQIQEARNHIQGQGIADLVAAVANLSGTCAYVYIYIYINKKKKGIRVYVDLVGGCFECRHKQ